MTSETKKVMRASVFTKSDDPSNIVHEGDNNIKSEIEPSSKYPKSVFFIIGNEFCERFSFYGMKAILPIYLTAYLGFRENSATTIIHTFNFSAYFFALFGGILSDNFIGKFRTILYLSIIYCIGNGVMGLTSLPGVTGTPPHWWGMAIGLVLIGVGTGGIKPCVASFGGDQFEPNQVVELSRFFSLFYFAINAGSVISMFLTPLLRKNVHCFGQQSCYPLAFGVPAALMCLALIVFVLGSSMYKKEPVRNNVVVQFFGLVGTSIWRGFKSILPKSKANPNPQHGWVGRASDKYEISFIEDSTRVLSVFTVFIPICFFWALYDQQGSTWVYQAVMMKNKVSIFGLDFTILPEQMGLANAFLILALIPFFSHCLYPLLNKMGLRMRAISRLGTGMFLCVLAFGIAAVLQFIMESNGTFIPSPEDPGTLMCTSGCINIMWQLPQYFVITLAEVFLSVTGLEFAYSEAPASMKSVCQAGWLLTVAGGNLIVILVTLVDPIGWFASEGSMQMGWNFCLWIGVMSVGMTLFAILGRGYKYRQDEPLPACKVEEEPTGLHVTDSQLSFTSDVPLINNKE